MKNYSYIYKQSEHSSLGWNSGLLLAFCFSFASIIILRELQQVVVGREFRSIHWLFEVFRILYVSLAVQIFCICIKRYRNSAFIWWCDLALLVHLHFNLDFSGTAVHLQGCSKFFGIMNHDLCWLFTAYLKQAFPEFDLFQIIFLIPLFVAGLWVCKF